MDDRSSREDKGYQQPEGFKLMQYRDDATGEVEWIWNSRNAVTPFVVRSRDGLRNMTHVRWNEDAYAPGWVPNVGDRIFVNLTIERAREHRRKYVERNWERVVYGEKMSDRWPTKEAAIEDLARADMESFGLGTPDVVVVDAETRARFAKAAAQRPTR